jgi:hypothetical protein
MFQYRSVFCALSRNCLSLPVIHRLVGLSVFPVLSLPLDVRATHRSRLFPQADEGFWMFLCLFTSLDEHIENLACPVAFFVQGYYGFDGVTSAPKSPIRHPSIYFFEHFFRSLN